MDAPREILAEARRHEDAQQWAEALTLVAPLAQTLRDGPDVVAAIEATWAEARSTARLGRGDESLAHATWALETASDPRHRANRWSRDAIVRIDAAFREWCEALHGCRSAPLATAVALARPALAFLDEAGCGQWHGGVFAALGNVAVARSAYAAAIPLYRSALGSKRSFPDTPGLGLATILVNLSRAYDWSGQHEAADEVLHELLALPDQTPDERHACYSLLAAGAQRQGDVEEALRRANEGMAFFATVQAIDVALFNGQLARATELLEGLDELADRFDRRDATKPYRTEVEERRRRIAAAEQA